MECEIKDTCANKDSSWCLECANNPGATLGDYYEELDGEDNE